MHLHRSYLYRNYELRTIYLTNYQSRTQIEFQSWVKPSLIVSLNSLITKTIPLLLYQAVVSLNDGKLRRPLDKILPKELYSNRSFSAAPSTQRSGGTDSETLNSFNDTSSPSDRSFLTRNDRSSSERDLSLILRKEEKQILERNKNFINPIIATLDSNSSKSPNTSGSKERSFYDEMNAGYYLTNSCYYPATALYPQYSYIPSSFQIDQLTQKYKKNPYTSTSTLNQQSKPFVPKREETKKLDSAATTFDQKKRNTYGNSPRQKEDKKESAKIKPARRPLGNTAGNSVQNGNNTASKLLRQIINRNKVAIKKKTNVPKRELSDTRMGQSKDKVNIVIDQDDNDILSDVYASEELMGRKREIRKWQFRVKKSKKTTQKLMVGNGTKRNELGNILIDNRAKRI